MTAVLVTGCACFIGSHLVDKLLDEVIGKGLGYVGLP
jgi:nucleoside-diphosphate-sugar epimerase